MKKFNTKTLLIGMLIIIGIFVIVFTAFGQKAYGQKLLDPPTDLYATVDDENDVSLFWSEPNTGEPTYLHWDSGENEDSFGNFLGPVTWTFAAKYDPIHIQNYDGWEVKKIKFWAMSPLATVKIKVMTGPDATEVYSQDVPAINPNNWTEINLITPVTIDASTELWIGVYIDMPVPGGAIGTDNGPAIDGYGDMYYFLGNWYHDFNTNWNIHAYIENPADRGSESLLGYNLFRNDEKLNDETIGNTSYVDMNLLNGTYDYYVTAVYEDGESDPSNTIEVLINQPVIAFQDSMALVDIYNNCNGPNWIINDNWLEGPVNEWYGVVTTGTRVTELWLQSRNLTGSIPESLGDLTALQSLHLSSNNITSIPTSIGDLTALEELWLGWTPISSIPTSIGNLTSLRELHLGQMDTPLVTLPDEFCNLESLEWLALGGSGLEYLPADFGDLQSLESLFLWGNLLTSLPESFGNLISLDYLTLDDNAITQLPENFGNLDNLITLRAEGNQLTAFPASFSDLASLEIVWARNNQINALPQDIGNLNNLKFINLSYNQIVEFPASITILSSIKELLFDWNQISSIPEDIGSLSTLEVLGLIGNNISSVPESIGDLGALDILGLASNEIPVLPESFGYLNADSIYLNNNLLRELPSTMFDNEFDFLMTYNNYLQFGSVEPFVGNVLYKYFYAPQGLIGNDTVVEIMDGQDLSYTLEVSGENNVYQWYKDSVMIQGQNTNTLTLSNVDANDEGLYYMEVTNTLATDLVLTSHLIELVIGDCEPWTYQITGSIHSVNIPALVNPTINGAPLKTGDWIGAFFLDENGEEVCGGTMMWTPFGRGVVNIYGDDPTTPEKDGFDEGEEFIWKMYSCNDAMSYSAIASYDPEMPNQQYFTDLGASALTSLTNIACQEFELMAGWNDISSYLVPDDPAVQVMLADVVDNMLLMRNLTHIYWPGAGVNTIGDWDNASGYAINFTENVSMEICGNEIVSKTLDINGGWSYLPVPSECAVDVDEVFAGLQEIVIIQDLIGTEIYWPAEGIYSLTTLQPGKAYKIKTNQALTVTFPECNGRTKSSRISNNTMSLPAGEIHMTPFSETVSLNKKAIENFEAGDVVVAYNQSGMVCGMTQINGSSTKQALVLFGDDPATEAIEGLAEEEAVSFKLYKSASGEKYDLYAEFDAAFENYDGRFRDRSLAGIQAFKLTSTSIEEMFGAEEMIYPNPAKEFVNILIPSTIEEPVNVEIINLQGKTMLRSQVDQGTVTINISNLKAGVYIVKASTQNFIRMEKLVVK
jgi:Leucine-rich repeat (LRR) protein